MVHAHSGSGSIGGGTDRAQDAAAERMIALGFVAALGVWMLLASALGVG
jgi:hypothetical protein